MSDDYMDFRMKPLEKNKMSVKKFKKKLHKGDGGIIEIGDILETFLTQFSKLELRWIYLHIKYSLEKKYNLSGREIK
ncbi:MAG: hypothetical protein ACFFDF_14130 [Candidatus Odinarchaeota archaeon]